MLTTLERLQAMYKYMQRPGMLMLAGAPPPRFFL